MATFTAMDKILTPHGFTREHNEPRSHAFALYDQVVVDRAFGGRFENKEGKDGLARMGGNFKIWDVLIDEYPGEPHKAFKPGTAAAANPVCMSCKSSDHILDWAYLGDPVPDAKWSRLSKVNEFVKDTNHSLNCIFCHDPHSAKPRVIRDGLIQALTRPEKDTLWHKDPKGAKIDVKDLGERGFTRKIAMLSRYDTKLQCGQCHVEYNCNPGTDPTTGQPIGMADQRTNHFPFKAVDDIAAALQGPEVRRLQARHHRRHAVEGPAPRRRDLLQQHAPEGRRGVQLLPHAQGQGPEDRQDLHLALADLAAALHQGNLPDLPQDLDREAGASTPSTR